MDKLLKTFIIFIFFMIVAVFINTVNAATASISANKTTANVGDTVTVTVTINAAAWNLKVSGAATGSIVGYNSEAENMTTTKTYNINTSSTGTYTVNLTGDITDESANSANSVNKSVSITINSAPVSQETSKTNTGTTGKSTTTTKSTITKKTTTTESTSNKKVNSESDKPVENEEQTPIIEEVVEIKDLLESLVVEGYNLEPEFNSEVYEYSVKIKEKDKLDIIAKANKEELKVEIIGNENLGFGENEILINLKNADDTIVATYKLKVTREKTELETANEKIQSLENTNKMLNQELKMFYVITIICIITIIVLGINLYINRRKKSRNLI